MASMLQGINTSFSKSNMPTPHQRPRPHPRTVRAHDRMLPVSSGSGMPSLCSLRIAFDVLFQLTLREFGSYVKGRMRDVCSRFERLAAKYAWLARTLCGIGWRCKVWFPSLSIPDFLVLPSIHPRTPGKASEEKATKNATLGSFLNNRPSKEEVISVVPQLRCAHATWSESYLCCIRALHSLV